MKWKLVLALISTQILYSSSAGFKQDPEKIKEIAAKIKEIDAGVDTLDRMEDRLIAKWEEKYFAGPHLIQHAWLKEDNIAPDTWRRYQGLLFRTKIFNERKMKLLKNNHSTDFIEKRYEALLIKNIDILAMRAKNYEPVLVHFFTNNYFSENVLNAYQMYVSKCKKLDLCDDKRFIIRALYEHNPLVIQYLADHDVDKYGVAAKLRNIAARYKKLSDVESEDFKQWLGQIQEKKICVWNFQKWGEVIPRITTV